MLLIALTACKGTATPTDAPTPTDTDVPTVETCDDDANEPNDTIETASTLGASAQAVATSGNEDFWSLAIPAGQRARVTMVVPQSSADLDLELQFPTGSVLDASNEAGGVDEAVEAYNLADFDQSFALRVFRVDSLPDTCEGYTLVTDFVCDEVDDMPDDRDDAFGLGVGDEVRGQAAFDDWDWYAVAVGAGDEDRFLVSFAGSVGALDYEVWLDDGQELADGTLDASEPIVLNNADSVTLTFLVGLRSTSGDCNLYDVVVDD